MADALLKSSRGYVAKVRYADDERVLYHSWDENGERLQVNGSRSAKGFFAEFDAPTGARQFRAA